MTAAILIGATGVLFAGGPRPAARYGFTAITGQAVVGNPAWAIPLLAGVATLAFLAIGQVSAMIAVVLVAATAGYLAREIVRARRAAAMDSALESVLGQVVADLRVGMLLPQALAAAVEAQPDGVVREELSTAAEIAMRGGRGYELLAASMSPRLRRLGSLWAITQTHGVAAADLFDQAYRQMRASGEHRASTSANLQGPVASAVIMTILPAAGVLMGAGMGAEPLRFLFGGGIGGTLLVIGIALECAGLYVFHRIIDAARSGGSERGRP